MIYRTTTVGAATVLLAVSRAALAGTAAFQDIRVIHHAQK
jgi:hypothetical protein